MSLPRPGFKVAPLPSNPKPLNSAAALLPSDTPPPEARRLPGDLAIWIFILAELTTFTAFFGAYAFARARNVALFNASQLTLDLDSGAINTLLLITGSWFVVLAVQAIKADRRRASLLWLSAAQLSGVGFLTIKLLEYGAKMSAGIDMSTNTFYMFYYSLTFFHLMHVLFAMAFLGIVMVKMRGGAYDSRNHSTVESAAAFWHMVDLLWIVLFPLVYVMR